MSSVYCPECDATFADGFQYDKESAAKSHNEWYGHNARVKKLGESIDA